MLVFFAHLPTTILFCSLFSAMSHILVSGSIATDVIMNFHDQFGKYILPDRTDKLSVSFNIDHLVRHPGGAGHNIAYNL